MSTNARWTADEWRAHVAQLEERQERLLLPAPVEERSGAYGLSGLNDPSTPMYQALVNISDGIQIGQGSSGLPDLPGVTLSTSVRVSAVYRAVSLLAGSLAGLPVKLYDEPSGGGRTRVYPKEDQTVWWEPNPEMDLPTFYKTSFAHNVLAGNTYWYLTRDGLGRPVEIWPVEPNRVRVGRDPLTRRKVYLVDSEMAEMDAGYGGQMVHIPNLTLDGLTGLNPIQFARMALQLARAGEEYGARLFTNGSAPMGIITTDGDLSDDQADKLARRWEKFHRGYRNAHRIGIIDNGGKFQQIAINPADAQFLDSRRFQIQEVARLFGIPPHLLADSSNSTSWGSGLEEQNRAMVVYTLSDYTNRFEWALTHRVVAKPGRVVRFDYRALLRGSTLQRYTAYKLGIDAGWLSPNEVREFEDMDRVEDLDTFTQVGTVPTATPDATSAGRMDELQAAIDAIKARLDAAA